MKIHQGFLNSFSMFNIIVANNTHRIFEVAKVWKIQFKNKNTRLYKFHFQIWSIIFRCQGILSKQKFPTIKSVSLTGEGRGMGVGQSMVVTIQNYHFFWRSSILHQKMKKGRDKGDQNEWQGYFGPLCQTLLLFNRVRYRVFIKNCVFSLCIATHPSPTYLCKGVSKLSRQCECTVIPIGWPIFG